MRSFSHCAPCVACRMFNIRVVGFLLIGIVTLYLLLNSCSQAIKNDVNSPGNPIEKNSSHRIVRRFGRPRRGLRLIKEIEKKFETKYIKNMMTLNTSVLSPLGAFIPVFVLSYGAQGRTRSKFIKALQINGQKTSLAKQGFRRWLEILANHNLRIATKIYYPASYLRPRLSFKDMASFYLHTVMQSIDLDDGHIPSEKINKWLSRKANNRPDVALFEPDHDSENGEIAPIKPLGSDPVMLLVSVVYFKGIWETRFSQTFLRPFTKLNGKQVDTPTMYNYGDYEYGELPELESRFVKIPFHGTSASGSTSMFVILPNALSTYQDLCSRLEQINVKDLYHKGTMAKVDLYLPKFRLESNISLDEWLPTFLGEYKCSDSPATFARMFTSSPEARLGPSQSRAVIEIDENGAVNEQASGYFYRRRKPRGVDAPKMVEFKADHPFIAIIATGGDVILNLFTIFFDGRSA